MSKPAPYASVSRTVLISLFACSVIFWVCNQLFAGDNDTPHLTFAALYGLVALAGGIIGLHSAGHWGGFKSAMGRAVIMLSIGLLFAEFGQLVFSFYNIVLGVEVPYPSIADIGFFGSIPFYILGAYYLSRVVNLRIGKFKSLTKLVIVLPIIWMIGLFIYFFFLKGYSFEGLGLLQIVLDFGYPIGQGIYTIFAVIILIGAGNVLGGAMKSRILMLLAAYAMQYAADFNFLYQSYHETWSNGGYGDLLYLIAYFLMAMSLISLAAPLKQVKDHE